MTDDVPAQDWTTVLPEMTDLDGTEFHTVCFEPAGWKGKGITVGLGIPECEMQYVYPPLTSEGEPFVVINRPRVNKNVKHWLRHVCNCATTDCAFVILSCDTAEQAAQAAKMATRWLPQHRRAALERIHNAATRARDKLS